MVEIVRRAGPSRLTKHDCLLVALIALVFGGVYLIASARARMSDQVRDGARPLESAPSPGPARRRGFHLSPMSSNTLSRAADTRYL